MTTDLATITTTLAATSAHWLRSQPYDHSNLSQFVCSCGQVFIPHWESMPNGWPSLPKLHEVLSLAEAITGKLETERLADLPELRPGAVFRGVDGQLYRFLRQDRWIGQNGHTYDDGVVAMLTPSLIWMPA